MEAPSNQESKLNTDVKSFGAFYSKNRRENIFSTLIPL